MAIDPGQVAGTLSRGAAQAERQKEKQGPFDIWTTTGEGIAENARRTLADPAGAMRAEAEGRARQARALLPDQWSRSDLASTGDALAASAEGTGKAFGKIADAEGALATTGAVFGALTSLEQTLSVPFSAIPFPAFPAVRITDMAVGLPHGHAHPPNLIPPAPMIPLPSAGPVIPIPYVSGAATVLINNMPAARCGDMGLGIWCGGYFPMYEIFLGSSSVWLEGSRAARLAVDITKHCIFSSPKPSDPPVGPMVGTTVSSSPNVVIGGVPMPSLMSMAMGAAFKAVFKGIAKVRKLVRAADDVAEEAGQAFSRQAQLDLMAKRPVPVRRAPGGLWSSGKMIRPDGRISGRRFAGAYRAEQLARAKAMGIEVVENADDILDKAGAKNAAAAFDYDKGRILMRSDASRYEFFHELQHAEHWLELGKKTNDYQNLGRFAREKRVYDRIMRDSHLFNPYEIEHARGYINDLAHMYGQPPVK